MNPQLKTPILFIVFNRPETTAKVFETIRQAKPTRLFVAADGSRDGRAGEKELCATVRQIATNVDWPCQVETLFREKNLGCKNAVSSAITWFFNNVEQGIILEDDCLPNQSFFTFCELMLEKYRDTEKVMMVSGINRLDANEADKDYFFSRLYSIWGWATWKRAWQKYDIEMTGWEQRRKNNELAKMFTHKRMTNVYAEIFDSVYINKVDTWDAQWAYSCLFNNGLSITPKYNLVSNIGSAGTHTHKGKNPSLFRPTRDFVCKFNDDLAIAPNNKQDWIQFKIAYPTRYLRNIAYKIYKMIK